MMKKNPNTIIIHKVEFYIDGIKQDKITTTFSNERNDKKYRNHPLFVPQIQHNKNAYGSAKKSKKSNANNNSDQNNS
jgi:aromatic ring hydroxylase